MDRYADAGPHRLIVAADGDAIVGYATSGKFREKPAYLTSVETTVYVRPDHHGRGIGTRLYAALFTALAHEDLHRAFAGIVLPNPASEALHARFGFRPVGLFREVGRKFGRYWDVQWLERPLP
jgi:phosphinothricin acetyltransferase